MHVLALRASAELGQKNVGKLCTARCHSDFRGLLFSAGIMVGRKPQIVDCVLFLGINNHQLDKKPTKMLRHSSVCLTESSESTLFRLNACFGDAMNPL